MQVRNLGLAAALAMGLAACNQNPPAMPEQQQQQQQQPPAAGDGGYGPFGLNAPPQGPVAPNVGGVEAVVSGQSQAPPEFQNLITSYLGNYAQQMAQGWSTPPTVPDTVATLQVDGEHRWEVSLLGGQRYAFIGACDNECDNVDLVLEDAATGQQIEADVLADDYPLVNVKPNVSGVYRLRIVLKTCTVAPCYVGARLVRSP